MKGFRFKSQAPRPKSQIKNHESKFKNSRFNYPEKSSCYPSPTRFSPLAHSHFTTLPSPLRPSPFTLSPFRPFALSPFTPSPTRSIAPSPSRSLTPQPPRFPQSAVLRGTGEKSGLRSVHLWCNNVQSLASHFLYSTHRQPGSHQYHLLVLGY